MPLDPNAVPALLRALDSDDVFVRITAAEALGKIGNPVAIGRLLDTYEDPRPDVRRRVVMALLRIGVETGQMMTMDDLDPEAYRRAMASRDDRHWVYHRAGLPCRVCGTEIVLEEMGARKLYWCPSCQK